MEAEKFTPPKKVYSTTQKNLPHKKGQVLQNFV
jgi:hypothetical protein